MYESSSDTDVTYWRHGKFDAPPLSMPGIVTARYHGARSRQAGFGMTQVSIRCLRHAFVLIASRYDEGAIPRNEHSP